MKKYLKIFSKAVRRMKLKLYMHAYDINLYKVCVFYCPCPTTLVALANCSFQLSYTGNLQTQRFCITQVSYVADRPLVHTVAN